MTNREKVLRMLTLSNVMVRNISDYLYSEPVWSVDRFTEGAAGVISYYLHNDHICGGEIAQGIREIMGDIENDRKTALCTDPYSFYRKHRALAAISRAYFYDISDRDILYEISARTHNYKSFSISYASWFLEALKRCLSATEEHHDTKDLYHCFCASFIKSDHLHLWNKMILPPQHEPQYVGQVGFVFEQNPLSDSASGAGTNLMRQLTQEYTRYEKELEQEKELEDIRRKAPASRRSLHIKLSELLTTIPSDEVLAVVFPSSKKKGKPYVTRQDLFMLCLYLDGYTLKEIGIKAGLTLTTQAILNRIKKSYRILRSEVEIDMDVTRFHEKEQVRQPPNRHHQLKSPQPKRTELEQMKYERDQLALYICTHISANPLQCRYKIYAVYCQFSYTHNRMDCIECVVKHLTTKWDSG